MIQVKDRHLVLHGYLNGTLPQVQAQHGWSEEEVTDALTRIDALIFGQEGRHGHPPQIATLFFGENDEVSAEDIVAYKAARAAARTPVAQPEQPSASMSEQAQSEEPADLEAEALQVAAQTEQPSTPIVEQQQSEAPADLEAEALRAVAQTEQPSAPMIEQQQSEAPADLEAEIERLTQELAKANEAYEAISAENLSLHTQLGATHMECAEALTGVKEKTQRIEELNAEVARLKEIEFLFDQGKEEIQRLNGLLAVAEEKKTQLQQENTQLQEERASLQEQLESEKKKNRCKELNEGQFSAAMKSVQLTEVRRERDSALREKNSFLFLSLLLLLIAGAASVFALFTVNSNREEKNRIATTLRTPGISALVGYERKPYHLELNVAQQVTADPESLKSLLQQRLWGVMGYQDVFPPVDEKLRQDLQYLIEHAPELFLSREEFSHLKFPSVRIDGIAPALETQQDLYRYVVCPSAGNRFQVCGGVARK